MYISRVGAQSKGNEFQLGLANCFTPTSAFWLNAVEGFFAKLTKRRLKRGTFGSLVASQAAINRFIARTNQSPKPFVWTADPKRITQAAKRGYQALDTHH